MKEIKQNKDVRIYQETNNNGTKTVRNSDYRAGIWPTTT